MDEEDESVTRPRAESEEVKVDRKQQAIQFKAQHALLVAFFLLLFVFHALAIYLFCSGFLLSRLVLQDRSECALPPVELGDGYTAGSIEKGCWHPKSFDKAVIILIDALRYDFTVPYRPEPGDDRVFHFRNALSTLYDTSVQQPAHAFLRPFIADPPTTTLQRLKALTTGTLPTFIDAGSNFAGTAIDEDNLIEQLFNAGKKMVHLGDDTWDSLFPGYFERNLSRPYHSFDTRDLHTVDNGVNEHLFPLLERSNSGGWDILIGHYLGVDHAGHRYGPDHPEMTAKLLQTDAALKRMVSLLDDTTLLVVMGDHGMDTKGDHGGESDLEVEAALWMYSKQPVFGRSNPAFVEPPATAKERPVTQIDLVSTLALLLGLPVPFNNLGQPIEEAFIKPTGNDYKNMAQVSRLTSAQIQNYLGQYAKARKLEDRTLLPISALWRNANAMWDGVTAGHKDRSQTWETVYQAFAAYQDKNLQLFKGLWARFDLVSMSMGIITLVGVFAIVCIYAQGILADPSELAPALLIRGAVGTAIGGAVGAGLGFHPAVPFSQATAFGAASIGIIATLSGLWSGRQFMRVPRPTTFWGGLCTLSTLLLCVGFAANSFTIWEDEQLLFLLTTFGLIMLLSSLGLEDKTDRGIGAFNSLSFLAATRLSSLSRLCREEQEPTCRSTYYASAMSSTSAGWQLSIPFLVALFLPAAIKHFYVGTRNYQGSAVIWIGIALRLGLLISAIFWVVDAADDGNWYPQLAEETLKTARAYLAQTVLAIAFAAGYGTYIWASPLLLVRTEEPKTSPSVISKSLEPANAEAPVLTAINGSPQPRSKLIILGYANTQGSRYFLLPAVWILALLLLQKPMGQGTLALCMVSIINVLEVIDANNLRRSPFGPTLFALMGSYYFFKTGHQAVLATIQWEAAYIPLKTLQYPWSPLLIVLNTYGAQILCAIAVPAISMWKVQPKLPGLLGRIASAMATHLLFYAAIAVATVVECAWLRRHLMLYRVFMPRMLISITVLLVVELVGAIVAIGGVRWSMISVGEVFGWPG